jgi:hypothetical protein
MVVAQAAFILGVVDPMAPFTDTEPCWCGSGRAYGTCHGRPVPSQPGAPLPDDEDGRFWISPTTSISPELIQSMAHEIAGVPAHLPPAEPAQRPPRVHSIAEALVRQPGRSPSVALSEIGKLRFEILAGLGLNDPEQLGPRVDSMTEAGLDELANGGLDLAKTTVDRLLEQAQSEAAPSVLWADDDDVATVIGRTLFWGDHYVIPDPLGDALFGAPR